MVIIFEDLPQIIFFKKSEKSVSMAVPVYNVIVNVGDLTVGNRGFITYHKVNSLDKFKSFISKKYPLWKFATIYNNLTKEKIEVIKP